MARPQPSRRGADSWAAALGGPAIVLGVLAALAGVVLIVVGAVKAATCRTVFGVALYRWATGEGALGPFSEDDLIRAAFSLVGSESIDHAI